MGFRENLLKKIKIHMLSAKVTASLAPPVDAAKFDKQSMRRLLEMGGYPHVKKRDLDLYILENGGEKKRILVLDNGLAIYRTTVEDVALRKSPTVKEMISIRNAIKILNDKDVRLSKREDSVLSVRDDLEGKLDLTYETADIAALEKDGIASLKNDYLEGVMESLVLFSELLGYKAAPRVFQASHHHIVGAHSRKPSGGMLFGPCVIYNRMHNTLKLVEMPLDSRDKNQVDRFHQIVKGKKESDREGVPVFAFLKRAVLHPEKQALSPKAE